jgi:prepilin-type N-terminal cleavage/methylation domain-containing protein
VARRRAGFSLVEMLVTIVLVGLAMAGVFGGIRSLMTAEFKAREANLLQRLAADKLNEIGPVTDPRTADTSGDFTDAGHADITWTLEVESTSTLNVEQVTVTATRGESSQTISSMIFLRPLTTEGT